MNIDALVSGGTLSIYESPITIEFASSVTGGDFYESEPGVIKAKFKNAKRARAALSAIREAAEQSEQDGKPAKTGTRYPELVEIAERDGLNRGKGWIASDYDVDRLSLHPSWVGLAICYVYE